MLSQLLKAELAEREVRFFSTIELVNALEQEKAQGKAGKIAEALVKTDLVVLDELGYLPFSVANRKNLVTLELLNSERISTPWHSFSLAHPFRSVLSILAVYRSGRSVQIRLKLAGRKCMSKVTGGIHSCLSM